MRPHPSFNTRTIPSVYTLGDVTLRALSTDDLDRDFAAIVESAADIKAANPQSSWPDGLTKEANLIDLAWHQREFEARRSFAWVMENAQGDYLGCLYVYPSISGESAADVAWWWRTGAAVSKLALRRELQAWFSSETWPRLDYRLQAE
jgi:hypothetical protein